MTPAEKISRMIQPPSLRSEEYQHWSRGRGTDVWAMICSCILGDLESVRALLDCDPKLIDCEYEYFKPIRFAVRENHRELVDFLLERGAGIAEESGDSLLEIARIRGYSELAAMIEHQLRNRYGIQPEGDATAEAIRNRDRNEIIRLLSDSSVNISDARGNQPIHWAVMTRQTWLIDYLLERGADINRARSDGLRPIHLTNGDYHYRGWRDLPAEALQTHEVLVGYLLARGADYDLPTAAKFGDYERVKELIDANPALIHELPTYSYYTGLPLRNAAAGGHLEVVRLLLERGADPNQPEPGIAPWGGALHSAIGGRHYEVVKLLLEHGANPNAAVESSGNCLFMAKHVNAPKKMIDLLVSYGAVMGVNHADLETLGAMLNANPKLETRERTDSPEMLKLILRYQPDLLKKSPEPKAWWDNATPPTPEIAEWLISQGLDPNRRNWLGITALHRCAATGRMEVAEAFLKCGADINAIETEWCSTPLGWAAKEGQQAMYDWLLSRGADPNLPADEPWAQPAEWIKRRASSGGTPPQPQA